jgi:GNAT superfamily N-acetyltransferase
MMNFTIRTVLLQDAEDITSIIREVGWFEHLKTESAQTTAERVRRHISLCLADDSHSAFVAEDANDKIIGYCSVHYLPYFFLSGPEGYVSELFVSGKVRAQGVGTALLEKVIAEARKRGCARLSLINSRTRESYLRQFYEKHGWKERAEVAAFVLPLI